jgi:ribonuclease HII
MIKADTKIQEVSAASILAKVTRDNEIISLAQKYPEYGFEKNKGYGTKAHLEALQKYDRCPIHRKTFRVKSLDEPPLL